MSDMLNLFCLNSVSMPYVSGNEYNLIELDKIKKN